MGLFKRSKGILESKLHSFLDGVEEKDPKATLDQAIRDAKEQLSEAVDGLAKIETLVFDFKRKLDDARKSAAKAEENAKIFAKNGKKDLFAKALEDKKKHEQLVISYQASYEKYSDKAEETRVFVDQLKDKIKDMEVREQEYVARIEAAKSIEEVNKALSGLSMDSFGQKLNRFEELANQAEARASASTHVYGEEKSLDEQAEDLERKHSDDELDNLMAEYSKKA